MRTSCFPSAEYYGLSSPALFEELTGFIIHTTATVLTANSAQAFPQPFRLQSTEGDPQV